MMRRFPAAFVGLAIVMLQRTPVVLSSDALGTEFESVPPELVGKRTWFGLFAADSEAKNAGHRARLQLAQVRFVPRRDAAGTTYRIETTPADAVLLIAALPGLTAGPAVTLIRSVTLSEQSRTVQLQLGSRRYTIRLDTRAPDLCDAVITLASE